MTYCPNNNYFILLGMDKEQLIAYIEDLQDEIEEIKNSDYISQEEYYEIIYERDDLQDQINDLEYDITELENTVAKLHDELTLYKTVKS